MFRFFRKLLPVILVFFSLSLTVYGTHNLGGQITFVKTGTNKFLFTITTYTDPAPAGVDRCEISFDAGDGNVYDKIPRINGVTGTCSSINANSKMGVVLTRTIKKNIYQVEHTYAGPGTYTVSFNDENRYGGIINMTNSVNLSFYVSTEVINNPFLGSNNSPVLLNDPIDFACVGQIFTHNPGGFDPDGDSLAYSLVPNQYLPNSTPINVPGYEYPDNVVGNTPGSFTIDPVTGLIVWNTPGAIGVYAISIKITEFRNGIEIGHVMRDMAIFVENNCNNEPPIIESITDTCVAAGAFLSIPIKVYDPNFEDPPGDSIYFYLNNPASASLNGPFSVSVSPATLIMQNPNVTVPPFPVAYKDTIKANVTWQTDCSHIRSQFYQVDLYAHDNISYQYTVGKEMLSTHHIIKIKVLPPATKGLVATPGNQLVNLIWNANPCTNAVGYFIYRKLNGGGFPSDTVCCTASPESAGYVQIGTTTSWSDTTFVDNSLPSADSYCYLVMAVFAGEVKSCPTNEVCIDLRKGSPQITNASVLVTDPGVGKMYVEWSTPKEFDTLLLQPPYTYNLYRADGITGNNFQMIGPVFSFTDTTYTDTLIDTQSQGYRYRVDFLDATNTVVGASSPASSVYLSTAPGDEKIDLSWSEFVPWNNTKYYIHRADTFGGPYVLLDSIQGTGANTHSYTDSSGLVNYEDYCYFITSRGTYGLPGIKPLLINDSQRTCDEPKDETAPCIPGPDSIFATSNCENFITQINWTLPDSACSSDLAYYTVYFSPTENGTYLPIYQTPDALTNFFTITGENTAAGCYALTATDTAGNESTMSQPFCFDNCPELELGNIFTPNNDGRNDFFTPIKLRSVKLLSFKIFDRWGALLFEQSEDIVHLWDGSTSNGPANDGVYYYVIEAELMKLKESEKVKKAGTVTLLR